MSHVLIVDDEPSICWGFRELLADEGHQVSVAPSAEEALALIDEDAPDAVMLDVRLPGMDGISAIQHMRSRLGETPCGRSRRARVTTCPSRLTWRTPSTS